MPKEFQGKIALDVRDSVPDWEPYLAPKAPKGSPNVLMIAWDDVGYGAMDVLRRADPDPDDAADREPRRARSATSTRRRCARRRVRRC